MTSYADEYKNTFTYFSRDIVGVDPHTLEDLQAHLEKFPEIAFVSIPYTWIGYGSSLMSDANYQALSDQFPNSVHYFECQLFLSRDEFFNEDSELVEIYFSLLEYPVYDEDYFNELEYNTIWEHVTEELAYEMELGHDEIVLLLENNDISIHEYCFIDNDGSTPYMSRGDLEALVSILESN